MTETERREIMAQRKLSRYPKHSPPHNASDKIHFHLTAACYEHQPIIGRSVERMAQFEKTLLEALQLNCDRVFAWCVLPNHYHCLIETEKILEVIRDIGKMHGRLSFQWNGEEDKRGRQVWFNCVERAMRSERHFWATVNYIHHNPVYHGYVQQWQGWPFSSAASYLETVGKDKAAEIWKSYPILDYGKGWDDANV